MKNLLYKELKLSMHYTCYIFPLVFGFLAMLPNYPAFVAPLYSVVCYPILFLGANKGQTTNDLFYTCNLPIRKCDVVKARLLTVSFLHLMSIVSTAIFMAVGLLVETKITESGGTVVNLGLGRDSFLAFFGVTIVGYALSDLIFIPWFYKTGKSITLPALVTIFFYAIYSVVFCLVLPKSIPGLATLLDVSSGGTTGLIVQFSVLGFAIAFYFAIRFLVYRISARELEKIDF